MELLTVASLVVVVIGLLGSCTLIFLSSGVGALPDDCIVIVVVDDDDDNTFPEDCIVLEVEALLVEAFEDLSDEEEDDLVSKEIVVPPAQVLLVLSS